MEGAATVSRSAGPRLLIVTDADLAPTSRGAGRTLLNLLSGWPAESVRVITTTRDQPVADQFGHPIRDAGWRLPGGVREQLRRWVGDMHAQAMAWCPLDEAALAGFSPEIILVVPTSAAPLVLGERWASALKIPSVTWLMDDWAQQYDARWLTDTARRTARRFLKTNAGWLVISEYLAEELRLWTGIVRPTAVVHNAVMIGEAPAALTSPRTGRFRLRYAGSIWPMHLDALALIARAVAARRMGGDDIELVLHTDERGWKQNEFLWRETGTISGGLVPYESLRGVLADTDLQVVASSYEPAHARISRTSVQTKITDYLATGRAILNVGPADGACARFLRARNIALFVDEPSVVTAADVLKRAQANRAGLAAIASRGWDVCKRDHEIGAVSHRMADFLAGLVKPQT